MSIFNQTQGYILFLNGLAFVLLALAAISLSRRQPTARPWRWLVAFGFVRGGHTWLEALALGLPDTPALDAACVATTIVALGSLIEFGRRGVGRRDGRRLHWWIYLPLLALATFGAMPGRVAGLHPLSVYVVGLASGGLACLALWQGTRTAPAGERAGLRVAAVSLAAYSLIAGPVMPPVAYLLAGWPNHERFFATTGIPMQLAQMICAGLTAYGVWQVRRATWQRALGGHAATAGDRDGAHLVIALVALFIAGWGGTAWVTRDADAQMRSELLTEIRMLAQTVDPIKVQALAGAATDLTTQDYLRLKEQLTAVRAVNPQIRFLYLMGMRADQVFFYVDSEPPESKDYSPPGQIYEEAAAELEWWQEMFQRSIESVTGPDTDRWGVWMSALAPIRQPLAEWALALLGIDVDARTWVRAVHRASLLPILLTLFITAVLVGALITSQRQLEANWHIATSEERYRLFLQNFIGIAYQADPLTFRPTMFHGTVAEITGYTAADFLTGRITWNQLIHLDDRTEARALGEKMIATDGPVADHAYRIVHRDGSVRWVRHIAKYRQEGRIQGIISDITDLVQAEESLRAERTLLRTLVDHLPDAVYVKDLAGRKTLANPADVRIMGVASEAAALGKTDFEVYPADMAAAFAADDQRVVSTGQPVLNREERFTNSDGSQGWGLTSKMPLRDPAGQVIGLVGIGHNITELKQAEFQREAAFATLTEREAQYRGLFEHASIAIYRSRPEGQSLQVNPAFARLFGYDSPEQVVALVPDAAAVFADPAQRAALIAHLQAGNDSLQSTHLYRRRDGTLFTGHLNVRAERDATGAIRYLEGFIEDITDRERAAAETATRARQQAAITELGQLALTGASLTTLLDQTVQRLAEVLDVDLCKVLELQRERGALLLRAGVGWHAGLVGQATVGIGQDSQAGFTLQSKQPVIVADLPTETRFHGPALLVEHGVISGVSTIIGAPERPYGVLGVHTTRRRDFSQQDVHFVQSVANLLADAIARVQAEDRLRATLVELQRSNADLERFAYIASHDLQEPLRMIASYAQLLSINYRGRLDADADEFIGYLVEGAMRMHQLLLDLLDYSSINTSAARPQPTDAALSYEMALNSLEPQIAETAATLTCDPLPTVLADPAQLTQIFEILIGNAIKFRGAEPLRVQVSARQTFEVSETSKVSAPVWEFAVRDNGIGIEPQYFERIFIIFQRLHTRRKYQGSGIGLAICKRIIERHGGRIWVESVPEQGSTFYFTLPAVI